MSTILDSLKKSSDQRDDSNNNSLDNFNFGRGYKSKGPNLLFVILLLIIVTGVIGYFGYQFLYSDEQQTPIDDSQVTSGSQTVAEERLTPVAQAENSNRIEKPNNKNVKQRIQTIKSNRQSEKEKLKKLNNQLPREAAANSQAEKIGQEKNKLEKTEQQSTPTKVKKEPMIKLTMPDENNPQVVTTVKKQDYMYLYQLPFSVRKDIPKISLNIHVYDKDPDNRIAIINGVKISVGDLIENEILLKGIIQDGIVLEFNGNEFLVPK
jgi:hypothetical protein